VGRATIECSHWRIEGWGNWNNARPMVEIYVILSCRTAYFVIYNKIETRQWHTGPGATKVLHCEAKRGKQGRAKIGPEAANVLDCEG
jgi:hypothetical protein